MEALASPEIWLSLATLTFLEIILGIDNVVFVSVAAGRLPVAEQARARQIGIWSGAALRVVLLFGLVWLAKLETPLFELPGFLQGLAHGDHPETFIQITAKDLILIGGGLFLLWKGTAEIHHAIEGDMHEDVGRPTGDFVKVLLQMAAINLVFSLDSVITAVGMTDVLIVMILAVLASTLVMVAAAKPVSDFIAAHPTTKMLALSFILLIGVALVADGLGFHIPRGYLYFAIAFSLAVETLNVFQRRSKKAPAH